MILYNSLSGKKEEFIPNVKGKVLMYTCGPTVYNYAHIGNLRTYIMEDVLEKSLKYLGYDVKRAMNITDVGHLQNDSDNGKDKMVEGAKKENKSVLEIAKYYTEAFKNDFKKLNLKWPTIVVPASSCIDTYIEMITKLLDKGFAYKSGGNIYFDTSKLEKYNVFSSQVKEELLVGAREDVDTDENKKNQQDFVLWFTKSKFENQALKWESPWGTGYPGWHIECSGINYKYLGEYLDIHCGGIDNKFPHHTNEIAQCEGLFGHKWCNYWFHVSHLNLKDAKMSKSSGNFVTVSKLIEMGYNPMVYKLFCLQSHYRNTLIFSNETIEGAKSVYTSIVKKIKLIDPNEGDLNKEVIAKYRSKFSEALSNDLNTSLAITVLFDMLKDNISGKEKAFLLNDFDTVLDLDLLSYLNSDKNENIDKNLLEFINSKIEERKEAKKNKDFALADFIRKELEIKGIILKDTREGTEYEIL